MEGSTLQQARSVDEVLANKCGRGRRRGDSSFNEYEERDS